MPCFVGSDCADRHAEIERLKAIYERQAKVIREHEWDSLCETIHTLNSALQASQAENAELRSRFSLSTNSPNFQSRLELRTRIEELKAENSELRGIVERTEFRAQLEQQAKVEQENAKLSKIVDQAERIAFDSKRCPTQLQGTNYFLISEDRMKNLLAALYDSGCAVHGPLATCDHCDCGCYEEPT